MGVCERATPPPAQPPGEVGPPVSDGSRWTRAGGLRLHDVCAAGPGLPCPRVPTLAAARPPGPQTSAACALRCGRAARLGLPGARSAWAVTGCFPAGPDRELRTVRQAMIDFLQNHTDESRPPACPPLDPIRCVARGESRRGRGRCVVPVAASVVGAGGDGRDRAERRLSSSKAQRPSLPHRQPCWPLCGGAV